MGYTTKIEWTGTFLDTPVEWKNEMTTFIPGATFNIVIGCTKVSPACKNCYAATMDERWNGDHWGPNKRRKQMSEAYWKKPLSWNKEAAAAGIKRKVFCSSMADWCEDHPDLVEPRRRLFELIEQTPNLIWLLLTKRPENILRFIPENWKIRPRANVWYGTTVESEYYLWRVHELCKVPAMFRFVSMEPLLGPVNMSPYINSAAYSTGAIFSDRYAFNGNGKIHWVIAGGESGKKSDIRLSNPNWFISLRDQCKEKIVPFFFKQWGEYYTRDIILSSGEPVFREFRNMQHWIDKAPTWVNGGRCISIDGTECKIGAHFENCKYPVTIMHYVGKKKAGNVLDGTTYTEMPDNQHFLKQIL